MSVKCVALLSGGLDSMLAIRLMQEQGIQVEAINFQTLFTCCQNEAGQRARQLGVRLTVLNQEDDYLDVVRKPQFGYGRGANPCVDCRIYMFQRARNFMEQIGAKFIVSGEVVGQRPMSQKRSDLDTISHHSELHDLLLRPLSAKLLPPTLPERNGWVDRDRLLGVHGRGRKELIALAKEYGFPEIPAPSTGCALTEVGFSRKVFDLMRLDKDSQRWDFDLLRTGRHLRGDSATKFIVGRHQQDNQRLTYLFGHSDARRATLLSPVGFPGPVTLIVGAGDADAIQLGCRVLLQYSREPQPDGQTIRVEQDGQAWSIHAKPGELPERLRNVAEPVA